MLNKSKLNKIWKTLDCTELVHETKWNEFYKDSNYVIEDDYLTCKFKHDDIVYKLFIEVNTKKFTLKPEKQKNKLLDFSDRVVNVDDISIELADKLMQVFDIIEHED